MPRHDYQCSVCGAQILEVYRTVAEGAVAHPPICCETPAEWIPQVGRIDASSGPAFKAFSITETVRGRDVTTQIDSLHALRKVERESEQLARNGEGRPLVWRDYSQGKSNGDVHTSGLDIGDPHGVRKAIAAGKHQVRSGAAVTAAHGTLGE